MLDAYLHCASMRLIFRCQPHVVNEQQQTFSGYGSHHGSLVVHLSLEDQGTRLMRTKMVGILQHVMSAVEIILN